MEIADIVKFLERYTGAFPREALEAAVEQREAITPELLRILEYTLANAEELVVEDREDEYFGHLFALHLLAQFRETRAFPLVVRFCELPGETLEHLLEETMTESLDRILASTFDGDMDALKRVIENPACNEYVHGAALMALVILVRMGVKQRDEVMAYLEELFRGKLERDPSFIWCGLADCAVLLYPEEVYADIRQAYEDGLVTPFFMRFSEVTEVLAMGKERVLEDLPSQVPGPIEDTIKEMERWTCLDDRPEPPYLSPTPVPRAHPALEPQKERVLEDLPSQAPGPIDDTIQEMERWACFDDAPEQPYLSPTPVPEAHAAAKPQKVGRNDPCPCGSGKKYKKCCG